MAISIHELVHQMPKAELHVHLEGSVSPQTVLELAYKNHMLDRLPASTLEGLQDWFQFKDFNNFLTIYLTIQDLLRTPDDFARIAYELGADMARQNIRYREVTLTPYTHTDYLDKNLTIQDILSGLEVGRQQAKDEFDVEIRWVFDIYRNLCFPDDDGEAFDPTPAEKTLEYALMGMPFGVVGLGIGGSEVNAPAKPFAPVFEQARKSGLASLPHAGENEGPRSVWSAVRDLQAARIGHGVRSIEDQRLMEHLAESQIPLEVCPTSNICLKVYPDIQDHPIWKLDSSSLMITINSDDPALFNTDLVKEYRLLIDIFNYKSHDLIRIGRNAFLASKADPATKKRLIQEFDTWVRDFLSAS